jgi:hypothetical protein
VVTRYYSSLHRYERGCTETKVDGITSCRSIERRASTKQEFRTTIDVAPPHALSAPSLAASHHADNSGLARAFCSYHQTGIFYCRCIAADFSIFDSYFQGSREEDSIWHIRKLTMYLYPVTDHIFSPCIYKIYGTYVLIHPADRSPHIVN